jgi:hypothetical protein
LYFALYFAFALLPLQAAMVADPHLIPRGFLVEFAVGIGFVAYSLILLELVRREKIETPTWHSCSVTASPKRMKTSRSLTTC